jgi:hypothetical protein
VTLKIKTSKRWLGILVAAIMATLLAGSACGGGDSGPVTTTVAVADESGDGTMTIVVESLPDLMGSLWGGVDPRSDHVFVGAANQGGDQLRIRGLYRFNIAAWSEGDLSFHNECVMLYGAPGDLEVYVLEDFGPLPAERPATPDQEDVSEIWNGGELVGTVTPVANEWFEVDVPEAQVAEYKSDDGYIAFMLKATGETTPATTLMAPNAAFLSSYEYAPGMGKDVPWVEWTA